VAFSGNLASAGDILVLFEEQFKVKIHQVDQLLGQGVALHEFFRD